MTLPRVRFAPSPTGYLHVGGLRTALYNYLFAKKHGGTFVLRIEDTDQTRLVEGAVKNLIEVLEWAGLTPDESPELNGKGGGAFGPYVQSKRLEIYKRHCEILVKSGNAYHCFSTAEELEEVRKLQQKQGLQPKYNRKWLPESLGGSAPESEIKRRLDAGEPHAIRMKVPDNRIIKVEDIVRGTVEFASETIDDQVLMKSDGFPTYHLANVVDDHLMQITHVIRGEEWLSSTPKHVLLYEFFGAAAEPQDNWAPPLFAHLPLLLNPDRTKLSKRQGDVAVEDYRAKGYSKEALINFVALLGWNEGGGSEQEIFSMDELVEKFSLEHVGKSGAVFNIEKLDWVEQQHIKRSTDAVLAAKIKPMLLDALKNKSAELPVEVITGDLYLEQVAAQMKERVNFISEFITFSSYFFFEPETYEPEAVKKRWTPETNALLTEFGLQLEAVQPFAAAEIEAALKTFAESKGLKPAALVHPLRLSTTGTSFGPSLYHLMEIIGKDACMRRIKRAALRITADAVPS